MNLLQEQSYNHLIKFAVVQCPVCGLIQTIQIKSIRLTTFKCRKDGCKITRKLIQKGKEGIQVKVFYYSLQARLAIEYCKGLKARLEK